MIEQKKQFYINGKWVNPINPNELKVIDPSNEEVCAIISLGSSADTDLAIESANKALPSWSKTSKADRLKLIEKLYVGQTGMIFSNVKNVIDYSQEFTYIVQIKNEDNNVVSLSWVTGEIMSSQELGMSVSWMPQEPGKYSVDRFVWNSIKGSIPLTDTVSTEILIKASKNKMRITEIPITITYENSTHSQEPFSHGTSVVVSTIKHVAIERPLLYYGVTGLFFLMLGLIFGGWTIQIYSEEQIVMTNIALIGIGGVILGTILLITATILYSIVNVVREER